MILPLFLALVSPTVGVYREFGAPIQAEKPPQGMENARFYLLALSDSAADLMEARTSGRYYFANPGAGDPAGFRAGAVNTLGLYEIGDTIPMVGSTQFAIRSPLTATLKVICGGETVAEKDGDRLEAPLKQSAECRAEAWRGSQLWISTGTTKAVTAGPGILQLPSMTLSEGVEAVRDITYSDGPAEDAEKHKLDVYRLKGSESRPVLFFIHGGAWRNGDRKQYPPIGNRFAREGFVVVVPSYRLAPKHVHPAQLEDVAAAFAWTVKNIAAQGGDPARIYVSGQSAGGHLAASIGLNPRWLKPHGLSPKNIKAVLALSGVYDLTGSAGVSVPAIFGSDPEELRQASPIKHVNPQAPPFLITYCQWDYALLPQQAESLHEALRKAGARSELVYVPKENHISEVLSMVKDDDVTSRAMLRVMGKP